MAVIRHASPADRENAGIICRRVLSDAYPYELNIGLGNCFNLVAEEAGSIVGFVSVLVTRWDPAGRFVWQRVAPYVAFIGVLPEYQGRGIGKSLLLSAIDEVRRRCPNQPRLFLEHAADNEKAKRRFERIGFRLMSSEELFATCGLRPKGPVRCFDLAQSR
jgi:ribosomal protein S18 acetylase RimI-like enzyme